MARSTATGRLILAAFLAGVFTAGLTPVADGDIFWHLAAGRQMALTHAILRADPFSVSAQGRPWIDVHWLFQLGVHAVHALGGLRALVLVKAALTTAGAWLLLRLVECEGGGRLPFAVAMVTALFLARHLLLVRPVVLTLVFMAVFLVVLERFRREGRPRLLWILPALQVVWINCQGLAPLGLGLVAAALAGALWNGRAPFAGERGPGGWRPLALTLGLCALASFVSPYGARAALLPFELLLRITPAGANVFAREVAENIPPFVLVRSAPGQIAALPFYLGALAVSFAVARHRLRLSRVLIVGGLVALALMANRNILLLYWLATPLAVIDLTATLDLEPGSSSRVRRALAAVLGVALAGVSALAVVAAAREPSLARPTPFRFPTESAERLAARPGAGTVFGADHQGGYLIWKDFPRFRPYLDTRLILRTAAEFGEFLRALDQPETFDALQARHHFDYAVLPTSFPDRYLPLAQHLAASPDWTLLFTDGSEALFGFRVNDPPVDLSRADTTRAILADLDQRYGGSLRTVARLNLARLDLVLGQTAQAEAIAGQMDDPAARALLARCKLVDGDLSGAEALARQRLAGDRRDVGSLNLLALVAIARGDSAAALGFVRQALEVDPYDGEALTLLARLEGK